MEERLQEGEPIVMISLWSVVLTLVYGRQGF